MIGSLRDDEDEVKNEQYSSIVLCSFNVHRLGALIHHQNNLRLVFSDIAKIEKEKCEKLHLRQIEVDRLETKLQQAQAETASLMEKIKHDSSGNEEVSKCSLLNSGCLSLAFCDTQHNCLFINGSCFPVS